MLFGLFSMFWRENIGNVRKGLWKRLKVNVGDKYRVINGIEGKVLGGSWVGLGWVIGGCFLQWIEFFHPGIRGLGLTQQTLNNVTVAM